MKRQLDADVAIIGGGIIGLACAYELAGGGLKVVVLERDKAGAGAGYVAAGMLAPASEAESEDASLVELAIESCRRYPAWLASIEAASGLSCDYRKEGSLMVALNRDHQEELERLAGIQRSLGLDPELISREAVLEREPYLSPRVTGGLSVESDRQVNPRTLTRALAAAVQSRGGTLIEGVSASPIVEEGRSVGVRADPPEETEVSAPVVVVAAGAWSQEVWPEQAGTLPLRPVKGQILRLKGPQLLQCVVRSPDVYLVPRLDGELVVGASMEEQGFDPAATAGWVMNLLREGWRLLPGIAEMELAEIGVGFRPALRDNLPAIGPTSLPGLFVATGHYRHGIMLAPITGMLLAQTIRDGRLPDLLRPFDPTRLGVADITTGGIS